MLGPTESVGARTLRQRVVVGLCLVVGGVVGLGSFNTAEAAVNCSKPFLYGLRGSGEMPGFGSTVGPLVKQLKARSTFTALPSAYRADPVNDWTHPPVGYVDSADNGARYVYNTVLQLQRQCRGRKMILVGYSQGAQSVYAALRRLARTSDGRRAFGFIVDVALFGSPVFRADSWAARGPFDPSRFGVMGRGYEFPAALRGRVLSYCRAGDIVCQGSGLSRLDGVGSAEHGNYVGGGHVTDAVNEIALDLGG